MQSGEQILRSGPTIKPSVARYFNEEYLGKECGDTVSKENRDTALT